MSKNIFNYILYTFLMLIFNTAYAEIEPDRPGFGTGTGVTPSNSSILEIGYLNSNELQSIPQINYRIGLNSMELSLYWDGVQFYDKESTPSQVTLGLKKQIELFPFTLLAYYTPSDQHMFKLGGAKDFEIFKSMPISSSVLIYESNDEIYSELAIGLSFSVHKKELFIELYNERNITQSTRLNNILNGGLIWELNNKLKVDLSLGSSLDEKFYFVGTGISFMFD